MSKQETIKNKFANISKKEKEHIVKKLTNSLIDQIESASSDAIKLDRMLN